MRRVLILSVTVATLTAWSNPESAEPTDARVRAPIEQPWSLSLHGGVNDSQGSFGNLVSGDFSLGIDLEYRFNSTFAVEVFLGHDSFDGESGIPDIDVSHIAVNSKAYFPAGSNEGYVLAGFGSYNFDPGSTDFGFNVGTGFESRVNPSTAWGVSLRYHYVDTSGDSTQFYALHAVLRFTF